MNRGITRQAHSFAGMSAGASMLRTVTTLRDPLIRPLGRKASTALESVLGLRTVGDLLRHYPRRYYTRGELTSLASLREDDHVTVLARVEYAKHIGPPADQRYRSSPRTRGSERLEVTVTDGTDRLTLTFFAGVRYHEKQLLPGKLGLFAGTVSSFRGRRQLVHPEYELLPDSSTDDGITAELAAEYATELIPVYPASAKLSSWQISRSVQVALDTLDAGEDPLPEQVREQYALWPREAAIRAIHRPQDREDLRRARERLKWDEAFVMQAALAQRRLAAAAMPAVPRPPEPDGIAAEFDGRLPFTLTEGQRFGGEVIARDLSGAYRMNGRRQGEVGSGKTVVAVRAMLQVVDALGQAALLAPTEVLAQQHYRSITELLGPLAASGQLGGAERATRVALLTGSTGKAARRSALSDVFTGDAGILIGTHALLEDRVQFADLGLVVIDEQHRFGVEQRDALRDKATGSRPHVLVMTATPIPRTVAMTVYGDLEVSTLAELPAGRQAYVVCPRIGDEAPGETAEDDADGDADAGADFTARRPPLAVLDMAVTLAEGPLSELRLDILHGRLNPDEKDRVMTAFASGEIDVLIATTVIEVGVDVPNATVMVVMDAERFGVSQLHQLRGRVGRGVAPGLCLLVTEAAEATPSRDRLDAVAGTLDGFRLAEIDLEQRREGDVLGASQSGRRSHLRLLSLLRDSETIAEARSAALDLIDRDPELDEHPLLRDWVADLVDEERATFLEKG